MTERARDSPRTVAFSSFNCGSESLNARISLMMMDIYKNHLEDGAAGDTYVGQTKVKSLYEGQLGASKYDFNDNYIG